MKITSQAKHSQKGHFRFCVAKQNESVFHMLRVPGTPPSPSPSPTLKFTPRKVVPSASRVRDKPINCSVPKPNRTEPKNPELNSSKESRNSIICLKESEIYGK